MRTLSPTRKLLIIDDDAGLRRSIARGLRPRGFEIIESDNGIDGLQLARAHSPDLIISDINMEHGDGYSVLAQLRQDPLLANIPLILMTGQGDPENMRRGMEQGADDFLAKPFNIKALQGAVEARLARHQTGASTQELLLKSLEATTDFVCVARLPDYQVLHLNRAGRELTGFSSAEHLESFRLQNFYSPGAWAAIRGAAIPAAIENGVSSGETNFVNRAGREIPVSQVLIVHANRAGAPEYLSLVARDLSERIHSERRLAESYAQLRDLTGRLVSVQEEERGRIAREIHDEFAQQLTGFNIDLAWLEKRVRESKSTPAHSQWLEKISTMQHQIKTTIQTVRRIATELRPAVLDSLGLVAALEWQAKEFQARTGTPCDFQCAVDHIESDSDRSTALFRIFQEALTNVARHAQARSVRASLTQTNEAIQLLVQDDGRGISEARLLARKSLGLLGMKERAFLVGGSLRITSGPGDGTRVEVEIPLGRKSTEA
jgi:PAS domain S-box-containing protein